MDLEDRARLISLYPDGLPAFFMAGNGKGHDYVRCAPPPSAGMARGNTVTVARLILAEEAIGGTVRYRDGDRCNLRRGNLRVTGKDTAGGTASVPPEAAEG
ncbi:hypothetical protein GXW78_26500 [Roseomonas terrae]|uniref:Uncharacterized protein n=1 Tax=Neoroseomonas terrae TaxID=424799 RepID=A0ABS5EQB9_9PROT|nr:hypothetical protein [Neoroseomonas terrae]MBR0653231.1 hypothetical protein [Neoroseomonas terrae]